MTLRRKSTFPDQVSLSSVGIAVRGPFLDLRRPSNDIDIPASSKLDPPRLSIIEGNNN